MKIKAYYIEDSDADIIGFTSHLNNGKIDLYPTLTDWYNDTTVIDKFIQNPNKETKENLITLFLNKNYDLFIVDIKLFRNDLGGKFLIEEIFSKDNRLSSKKIIVLAGKPPAGLPEQNKQFQTITKIGGSDTEIDYKKTSTALIFAIYDMFDIKDNILDDLKNDPIGFIRDLFK